MTDRREGIVVLKVSLGGANAVRPVLSKNAGPAFILFFRALDGRRGGSHGSGSENHAARGEHVILSQ